jgi:hypothetical protein
MPCFYRYFDATAGPFGEGSRDRLITLPEGGIMRFVAPVDGFNSHEWFTRREKISASMWHRASCWYPGMFAVHTKDVKLVNARDGACAATHVPTQQAPWLSLTKSEPGLFLVHGGSEPAGGSHVAGMREAEMRASTTAHKHMERQAAADAASRESRLAYEASKKLRKAAKAKAASDKATTKSNLG